MNIYEPQKVDLSRRHMDGLDAIVGNIELVYETYDFEDDYDDDAYYFVSELADRANDLSRDIYKFLKVFDITLQKQ